MSGAEIRSRTTTSSRSLGPHFQIATLPYAFLARIDKTGYEVSASPHSPHMSAHDRQATPPQDPEKVQAHLESQQSTKPNRDSSASGQLLTKVQCVYEGLLALYAVVDSPFVQKGIRHTWDHGRHASTEAMQTGGYDPVSPCPLLSG